ncbi:hypothetical protein [Glutamicibacter sp. NPDC087344]|uniref:hypothetical protein n=1 Tax=Glutamicibacter sp. NPDC087344 TaxID=3363994 RepID=UPI00380CDD2B
MNSALAQGLNTLNEVLEHLDPSLDGFCLSGTSLRTLATTLLDTLALLRESLATTTDPRLALELASTAQHLGFEASRMELVAAERANATAAHTLAQRELDTLREHPADTSTTPVRSTGRNCYRNPEELLAAWGRIPYAHTHRMVAEALDLVGRKDFTGARVPPRFEHLSVLLFTPGMDPAAVRAVSRKLAKVEPADLTFEGAATSPTLRHADGRTVEEHAAEVLADEFIPMAAVKKVSTLILEAINQGGPVPPPASLRRGLFALPIRSPYFREFLLRLSTAEGAWVDSWCASASKASTRAGRAARRNPASAAPSPPAGSSTGKGGRSGAPVPGDSFFRDPADNPNQPPAGAAGTEATDTSTDTCTGAGAEDVASTLATTATGNSAAEAAEAENGTSDSEAGSANNSTADATEAETGIDSNNNRTTDTANSAGTGTASSETGTTDSEAGSANGSTSDAECSTAEATESENSTATSGTGTTGAESGASTGNNTTETGADSTAGTTDTESGAVHGAGPDGQGAWSIQDLLPDDAEPFSWDDDDDLFIPEATPPERALNALLEILLDANDPASGPVKDGGVSVQSGDPVQGSLFDPDPDQETDPDTGPVEGAPPAPPPRKSSRLRPVVVAHMMIDDLKDLARSTAQTAHGVDLPPAALRELLCQADLIPAVFNAEGVLLDFGRAQRFVPKVLQRAVLARDRYCLVPGCLAKVEMLEFHHTDPYALGGHTRLDRIVPGCKSHHIEFDHGVVKIVWVRGLPWVLLPRDRDPVQRLRRNYSPPGVPTSIELPEEFSTG